MDAGDGKSTGLTLSDTYPLTCRDQTWVLGWGLTHIGDLPHIGHYSVFS